MIERAVLLEISREVAAQIKPVLWTGRVHNLSDVAEWSARCELRNGKTLPALLRAAFHQRGIALEASQEESLVHCATPYVVAELFPQPDANDFGIFLQALPLLTKVCQVQFVNGSDLRRLLTFLQSQAAPASENGKDHARRSQKADWQQWLQENEADWQRLRSQPSLYDLLDLGDVCELAQSLLTSLYEKDGVDWNDMDDFYTWESETRTHRFIAFHEVGPERVIPASALYEKVEDGGGKPLLALIVRDVKRILLQDHHLLARCEECCNIFERSRAGQRFCSDRCSSRARQRRWYHEKKSPITLNPVDAA